MLWSRCGSDFGRNRSRKGNSSNGVMLLVRNIVC